MNTFYIPGELMSLNEFINIQRTHPMKGNQVKQKNTNRCKRAVLEAIQQGLSFELPVYSGRSFCSCLIKYNRLCVCVIFHSSRITACCGQISKQFPQCRQCSCRIIAGMEVKSIQFCGQTVPQARQPSAAQLSDFAADRYCRTRHCIFAFHTCHRYISIGF